MNRYESQKRAIEVDMRELLGKARGYTTRAADEGRGLTEEEDKQVKSLLAQVEVLKEKRVEVEAAIATRLRVEEAGKAMLVDPGHREDGQDGAPKAIAFKSVGEAFVKSDGYRTLRDRGMTGNWTTGAVALEGKTLLTSGSSSGGDLIVQDVQQGILPVLQAPLRIVDLLAQGTTNSNTVDYMVETTATNGATTVAEGDTKPESALVFDRKTVSVKKIATMLPVTDEMLEDVAAIESYINGRLSLFVRQTEEDQILNGTGSGSDVDGILHQLPVGHTAVRSVISGPNNADHVYAGITKVRDSFLEPDAIVMHPDDWAGIMTMKDDNDRYYGSGPFSEGPDTLWGKRVVLSRSIDAGTALVGAFREGAQIFRRGGLTVEASNSHSDFFSKNKTAIRAEERFALAVYRPEAFARVDLGAAGLLT